MKMLLGAENYNSWSFQVKAYLELEGVWDVIEAPLNAEGQRGQLTIDPVKIKKARARLILSIHEALHPQIQSLTGSKAI